MKRWQSDYEEASIGAFSVPSDVYSVSGNVPLDFNFDSFLNNMAQFNIQSSNRVTVGPLAHRYLEVIGPRNGNLFAGNFLFTQWGHRWFDFWAQNIPSHRIFDAYITNRNGNDWDVFWDRRPNSIVWLQIRFPGQQYGVRASTWFGPSFDARGFVEIW